MLATLGLIVAAFVAVMWTLCYLRVVPVSVMRFWFVVVIAANVIVMAVTTFFIDLTRKVGVPVKVTKFLCTMVCRVTFAAIVRFNPQVRIHVDDASYKTWCSIPGPSCLVLNHTSFWDAFLFVGISPWTYIHNAKTLMKDSLKRLPVFGSIFDRVGHFPVYFKTEEDGNFAVDKERQAPVSAAVQQHLKDGGRICLFPEGAVNPSPRKLLSFRRGTFATIMENRLPVYYYVSAGNEATWPRGAPYGGFPTDIVISVKKFDIDYDKQDVVEVATKLQDAMQQDLDRNYAARARFMGVRE